MKNAKPNKIYYDLETTGFNRSKDQILEIAMAVVSPSWEILDVLELKVALRDGVIPTAGALLTNKINPYSKEWNDAAVSENEMFKKVQAFGDKWANRSGKPILSAYNGSPFDKHFIDRGGERNFLPVSSSFNESSRDPLITVRRLIDKNLLKTREEYDPRSGEMKSSAKQVDVAASLGVTYKGDAHRAMNDVMALIEIDRKLEEISESAHKNNYIALPELYEPGQVVRIATDSKSGGKKIRHIYVLKNDLEREVIYAIDEDDLNENKKVTASAVRKFSYGTIDKELDTDPNVAENLRALAANKKETIALFLKKKISDTTTEKEGDSNSLVNDFRTIRQIRERLTQATDLSSEIHKMRRELEQKGIDQKTIRELFMRVNDYHTACGGRAFFRPAPKMWEIINFEIGDAKVSITPNPIGHYQIEVVKHIFDKNGEKKTLTERKKEDSIGKLSKFLADTLGMSQKEVDEYLKNIPPMKVDDSKKDSAVQVRDSKHPLSMIHEWEDKTAALYSDEISPDLKHGIATIRKDIYRVYPEFGEPDEALFFGVDSTDNRSFESDVVSAVPVEPFSGQIALEDQLSKVVTQGVMPAEFVSSATKSDGTKCAVCGRAIKSEKSLFYVMGDKCRARLMAYESGIETPQQARVEKWGKLTDKTISNGGIYLIKQNSGDIGIYSINNKVFIPGKVRVIDRKTLTESLKAGFSLSESLEISTRDIEKRAIFGISRIEVGPDAHKKKAVEILSKKEANRVVVSELPTEYDAIFDEVKAIYKKAIERRRQNDEIAVDELRNKARDQVSKIVNDLIKKHNYPVIDIERINMIQIMNEHLFWDKQDLKKFVELVENGKNIDSQYLKMQNSKGEIMVFPNLKYRGFDIEKIGYGKPDHYHDDPFGPWDKEYGVSAKRLQALHRKGKRIEIHTSSPRIVDKMYENYLPKTAKIHLYLREAGADEKVYGSNKNIEDTAKILKERGFDVVLMSSKTREGA